MRYPFLQAYFLTDCVFNSSSTKQNVNIAHRLKMLPVFCPVAGCNAAVTYNHTNESRDITNFHIIQHILNKHMQRDVSICTECGRHSLGALTVSIHPCYIDDTLQNGIKAGPHSNSQCGQSSAHKTSFFGDEDDVAETIIDNTSCQELTEFSHEKCGAIVIGGLTGGSNNSVISNYKGEKGGRVVCEEYIDSSGNKSAAVVQATGVQRKRVKVLLLGATPPISESADEKLGTTPATTNQPTTQHVGNVKKLARISIFRTENSLCTNTERNKNDSNSPNKKLNSKKTKRKLKLEQEKREAKYGELIHVCPETSHYVCRVCRMVLVNGTGLAHHTNSVYHRVQLQSYQRGGLPLLPLQDINETVLIKSVAKTSAKIFASSERSRHQCPYCDKSYMKRMSLMRHLLDHSDHWPHVCSTCGVKFRRSYLYKEHVQQHMQGGSSHICHICHKSYCDKSSLTRHINNHTRERRYRCDTCGKSFSQSGVLHRHRCLSASVSSHITS